MSKKSELSEIQEAIEKLESNTTGDELNLYSVSFEGSEIEKFASALAGNTSLTSLNIMESSLSDDDARLIAGALEKNKTLKNLDLQGNAIGVDGFHSIAKALQDNHTLEAIDLNDNKYDFEGRQDDISKIEDSIENNHTIQRFGGVVSDKIKNSLERNQDTRYLIDTTDKIKELREERAYTPRDSDDWDDILIEAVESSNQKVLEFLLDGPNGVSLGGANDALDLAISGKDFVTADILVRNGVNIDNRGNDYPDILHVKDGTVLHVAALYGAEDLANSLVKQGANVNAQDQDGYTPLHFAVSGQHEPVRDLLVSNGANQELEDRHGCKARDSKPRQVVVEYAGHRFSGANYSQDNQSLQDQYPENTLSSLKNVMKTANWVEFDLMPSSDDKLMVTHDSDLSVHSKYIVPEDGVRTGADGKDFDVKKGDRLPFPEGQLRVQDHTKEALQKDFDVSSDIGEGHYQELDSNLYQMMPSFQQVLKMVGEENARRDDDGKPRIKLNTELKAENTGKLAQDEINTYNEENPEAQLHDSDFCFSSFLQNELIDLRKDNSNVEVVSAVSTKMIYAQVDENFTIEDTSLNPEGMKFIKNVNAELKKHGQGLTAIDVNCGDLGDDLINFANKELGVVVHSTYPIGAKNLENQANRAVLDNIEKSQELQQENLKPDLRHQREDLVLSIKVENVEAMQELELQRSQSKGKVKVLEVDGVPYRDRDGTELLKPDQENKRVPLLKKSQELKKDKEVKVEENKHEEGKEEEKEKEAAEPKPPPKGRRNKAVKAGNVGEEKTKNQENKPEVKAEKDEKVDKGKGEKQDPQKPQEFVPRKPTRVKRQEGLPPKVAQAAIALVKGMPIKLVEEKDEKTPKNPDKLPKNIEAKAEKEKNDGKGAGRIA